MKKCLSVIILLTVVFVSTGFSTTLGTWQGAPADANHPGNLVGTGKWTDAYWKPTGQLPPPPSSQDQEIKISKLKTVCTTDTNIGNYNCRLSITGGTDIATAPKLEIKKGTNLGVFEFRVGAGGAAATGGFGCVVQTGGTLNINGKLLIGRYGSSSNNPNDAKGFYTISGGTITYPATSDGLLCLGVYGASEGTLTVVGKGASISAKKLTIGGDGRKPGGTGTLEFKVDANGVSPIKVADSVSIDLGSQATTAKLAVSAVGAAPKADILLVDNLGNTPITGIFDTVNDKPAVEGAEVVLNAGGNNYFYKLTYKGGSGNDLMLKFDHAAPGAAPAAVKPAAPAPAAPVKPAPAPAAPAPAAPAPAAPAK